MATCDHLFTDLGFLIHQILEENEKAESKRNILYQAAITIQKTWRGYVVRRELRNLTKAVVTIQRWVRGYLVRVNLPEFILQYLQMSYDLFYDKMATKIQALWRGYWSRKMYSNFHSLWVMRTNIMKKNEELRLLMLAEQARAAERKKKIIEDEAKRMVLYIVFKLHHCMRTHQREGVFSIHGSQKLSKIEELIASAKFQHYMQLLKKKYNAGYFAAAARPLFKIPKMAEEEIPLMTHEKRFSFDPHLHDPCKIRHEKQLLASEPFKPRVINVERRTDWSKFITWKDFDITAKMVPPKKYPPPYYLDYWTRGCEIHDIPQTGPCEIKKEIAK